MTAGAAGVTLRFDFDAEFEEWDEEALMDAVRDAEGQQDRTYG